MSLLTSGLQDLQGSWDDAAFLKLDGWMERGKHISARVLALVLVLVLVLGGGNGNGNGIGMEMEN